MISESSKLDSLQVTFTLNVLGEGVVVRIDGEYVVLW